MSPSSKINAEEVDLLAALDRSALLEFAALLRLPPSSFIGHPNATASLPQPWLDAQRAAIETNLSPELLAAPKRGVKHTLGRLLGTAPGASSSDDNYTPPLCPSHALLNPDLITHCLALLRAEISFRCDVLRSYVNRGRLPSPSPSSPAFPHLNPDEQDTLDEIHHIRALVHTLSGLATLWLRPAEFEAYFGAAAAGSGSHRFERVRSGCGACVLSVVGGREEVLVALRANLLGRAKRKVGRLAPLVEAWVEKGGRREEVWRVRGESERLAGEVEGVREWMEKAKVERRARKEGKWVVGEKAKTGRSRHVGGMPEGTRVVEGMPMPRVRMDGVRERRRHAEDRDDRPFGGMDGMADFAQQHRPPGGPSETWSSSVSSSASDDEADTDNNGEFVPARQYWPHSPRTTAQGTPVHESVYGASPSRGGLKDDRPSSALSTMLQPTVYAAGMDAADSESVPIFLDQSTSSHAPPPLTLPRRHRQSEQSTATNWEDLYQKGKGKGNKRH